MKRLLIAAAIVLGSAGLATAQDAGKKKFTKVPVPVSGNVTGASVSADAEKKKTEAKLKKEADAKKIQNASGSAIVDPRAKNY